MITFDSLAAGTYSNCGVFVTDISGNTSLPLNVTPFTIDNIPATPVITSPQTSPTNNSPFTININFNESVT